jgi:hypothetical protein
MILFRSYVPGFLGRSGPLKGACFQSFIKQKESILLPDKAFDFSAA